MRSPRPAFLCSQGCEADATMTRPKINHRSEAMCVRRRRRLTHEPTAYDFPGDLYGQDPT
jgi:hypothetical protein